MKMQRSLVFVMFATILAAVLAACGGASNDSANQTDLTDTLIAKEQEKWNLFAQGKMDEVMNLYSEDFINIGYLPTGMVRQNKQEAFDMIAQMPPPSGPAPELSDFQVVQATYDAAIVTYTETAPWATLYVTSVWALRDGEWQTVFYQASDTMTSAAAAQSAAVQAEAAAPQAAEQPGKQASDSDLVVTIANGTCTLDGATAIKAGDVSVALNVNDSDKQGYSAVFTTLLAGKTLDDLLAASEGPNFGRPEWATNLALLDTGPNSSVSDSIHVVSGPLYVLCASWNQDRYRIGYLGPIEVSQ